MLRVKLRKDIFWEGRVPVICDGCLQPLQETLVKARTRASKHVVMHPGCARTQCWGDVEVYTRQPNDGKFKKLSS